MTRVVITGIGAVTPVGRDAESTLAGPARPAARASQRIDTFDVSSFPVQIAGMCSDFELDQLPDPSAARYLHRGERFGVAAAAEAVRNAGVEDGAYEPDEIGRGDRRLGRPPGAAGVLRRLRGAASESDGHAMHRFPAIKTLRDSQNTACLRGRPAGRRRAGR